MSMPTSTSMSMPMSTSTSKWAHSQIADPRKGGSSEVGHRDRIG
jgi:hypothetical protein